MNISQLLGNDPEVLRYQLMQQEMQRYNQYQDPRMNLASTLGGLLGGGVVNLAQGRGFFESNNPILRKASDLQRIYNETASSIDPNTNPGDFYRALQTNLAAAGYGQQAAMAAQEAYKYGQEERKLSLQERQVAATEANVLRPQATNLVTTKGLPVSFDRQTGGYVVGGKPYDADIHGGIRESSANPLGQIIREGQGTTTPGATAPKGKEGQKELTDAEKREIFNRGQNPDARPQPARDQGAEYRGEVYGPNTPDAVLLAGVKAKDKNAEKEYNRRLERRSADAASVVNNPLGF